LTTAGPRLFLFDIDGTLVFFRGAGRRAANAAFAEVFELPDPSGLTRDVALAGSTDSRIMRELAAACGLDESQYHARRPIVQRAYLARLRDEVAAFRGDPVLPGVRPCLEDLDKRPDCRIALLTGNYAEGARIKLAPTGLDGYFPTGGFGDDHEDRRVVAAVAYDRACQHHGVKIRPSDVFVVGDTPHDVDCAKANGFRAVAVCTGQYSRGDLAAAGAEFILDTLQASLGELDIRS
jgi:phosphoglycolate phosphatase-like HAD superfamily hydrolase